MKSSVKTPEGGPVISLERSDKIDELIVVWMSVDDPKFPIAGYLVFLDDIQCGQMVNRFYCLTLSNYNGLLH